MAPYAESVTAQKATEPSPERPETDAGAKGVAARRRALAKEVRRQEATAAAQL